MRFDDAFMTCVVSLLLLSGTECYRCSMSTYHVKKPSMTYVYKHARVMCTNMPGLCPYICQSYVPRHTIESSKQRFSNYSDILQSLPYPIQLGLDMQPNASLCPIFQMRLALPSSAKLGVRVLVSHVPKSIVLIKLRFYVVDDSPL